MAGRIEIDDVAPVVSGGRFPAKAVVGEVVPVRATVWREGHDAVSATLVVRYHGTAYPQLADDPPGRVSAGRARADRGGGQPAGTEVKPQLLPMSPGRTPDVFHGQFSPDSVGLWTFRVDGWGDPIATWRKARHRQARRRPERGRAVQRPARSARGCWSAPRRACRASTRYPLIEAAARLRKPGDPFTRAGAALSAEVDRAARRSIRCANWSPAASNTASGWTGRWPGSAPGTRCSRGPPAAGTPTGNPVHGTFATATKALPRIAKMGFDVVYLPPIHPIGKVHRKGRNNTVTAAPERRRLAVGDRQRRGRPRRRAPGAGHHRGLRRLRRRRPRTDGLEVALDLALQCAPDHPWAKDHPRVVHRAARRHHRLRGEPAEEVPGHLPDQLRQRSRRASTTRCCGWCGTGSATASRSSASTTRTPSRRTSGRG